MWNGRVIYLATFMDLCTREIVGWSVSTKHTTEFIIGAFWEAVMNVYSSKIVHTDQGSEYKHQRIHRKLKMSPAKFKQRLLNLPV